MVKIEKSTTPTADANPAELRRISKQSQMKAYFAEQDRETIRIRKADGDQTVRINGYGFRIQAGEPVKVPVDVDAVVAEVARCQAVDRVSATALPARRAVDVDSSCSRAAAAGGRLGAYDFQLDRGENHGS